MTDFKTYFTPLLAFGVKALHWNITHTAKNVPETGVIFTLPNLRYRVAPAAVIESDNPERVMFSISDVRISIPLRTHC